MTLNTRHAYSNSVWAFLLNDIDSDDVDIQVTPQSVSMLSPLFALQTTTNTFGYLALFDISGNSEIIKIEDLYDNWITVTRGQGGTTARAWPAGTVMAGRLVSGHLERFLQKRLYRSGAYNPNSVLTGNYTGEKFYQTGPADEQKRWWMNTVSSKWRHLNGTLWQYEKEDEFGYYIPSDTLVPISDILAGSWEPRPAGPSLYAMLDEGCDADSQRAGGFLEAKDDSIENGCFDCCILGLTDTGNPDGDYQFAIRALGNDRHLEAFATIEFEVTKQDSTVLHSETFIFNDWEVFEGVFGSPVTLTANECSNLRLVITNITDGCFDTFLLTSVEVILI